MPCLTCEEEPSLPAMTLCASYRTALELRSQFSFTRFVLRFDDSLPDNRLVVSSDFYDELHQYLLSQDQRGCPSTA